MAGGEAPGARDLEKTPTWAVSAVCAAMIVISIILEKILHKTAQWFHKKHNTALFDALEKVKTELMVLGFISLTLTFSQNYIVGICIPLRLLWYDQRRLAGDSGSKECKDGSVPLISARGLHQLRIFIFFLAVFHVVYSVITMLLRRMKVEGVHIGQTRNWKDWERESWLEHEAMNVSADCSDPTRFRLTHETSFVCFFRQFFRSVRKADYMTMRHGFISVHPAPGSKFNFQKYIKKTLEDDFKVAVGIRVGAQILCSYATLPLYALVTQMGSTMKRSIFDQQASKALKNWHKKAVKKTNEGKPGQLQTRTLGGSPDASSVHSPSLTPPRPMKFGTEDPDFTDVEADKMATVDLDANHQRRPSDSSFPFDPQDLLS
ncbi:hypothetical protein H0E87_011500 [Populus deltoides]|uniref:MLO-like protein n=1 Tax=Populus deltoides TaxID=3696 RepID=A0A8T2YXM9_POPDE|nr:hypothetical protein H0E87_011500 [Populus deltoides]